MIHERRTGTSRPGAPPQGGPETPKRLPRRWRLIAVATAACAIALSGAWAFWRSRQAPHFAAPLDALLCRTPILTVRVAGLSAMLRQIEQSRAFLDLGQDVGLGALLLGEEDWQEFVRDRRDPRLQAKAKIGRAFLERYFGAEAMLAVLPPAREGERPCLIALTRAETGFLERTAELVAALYPDLRLQRSRHEGAAIFLYASEKRRRSFSFVRLGGVIALSLRNRETAPLQEIIDRCRALSVKGAAQAETASQGAARAPGVYAEGEPASAFRAWVALWPRNAARFTAEQRIAVENALRDIDRLDMRFVPGAVSSLDLNLRYAEGSYQPLANAFPPANSRVGALPKTPAEPALVLLLSHPAPAEALRFVSGLIQRWPAKAPADAKERKEAEKRRRKREKRGEKTAEWLRLAETALGMNWASDVAPFLGQDCLLAILGTKPGLLAPMPEALFLSVRAETPSSPPAPSFHRAATLFGPMEITTAQTGVRIAIGEETAGVGARARTDRPPSIADQDDWKRLGLNDLAPHAVAAACVNFVRLRSVLQALVDSSAFWDDDTRADLVKARDVAGALAPLGAAGLAATPTSDSLGLSLRFLLD